MSHLKLFFFTLIFVIGTLRSSAQDRQLLPFSIAFYNIENLFDTIPNNPYGRDLDFTPQGRYVWTSQRYYSKLDNMAYVISRLGREITPLGPAVIGLAEVENRDVLEDLVRRPDLKRFNYQIVHYDSPDRRGIDNALLYNPLLFQVVSSKPYRVTCPTLPDMRTRDVLLVSGLMDGEKFHILVNHWPSRWGGERASRPRRIAAARVNRHIHDSLRIANPESKIIIMGDLNDDPNDISVRDVLGAALRRADVQPNGLYNPTAALHARGIGTLAFRGRWNLFDQIIISDNLLGDDRSTFKFWKAEIFNPDFLITREGRFKGYPLRTFSGNVFLNGFSDHFPVLIYLVKHFE